MQETARVFGRIFEENKFHSLLVCSCGNREWIVETEEDPKIVKCNICENIHYLKKNNIGRYMILKDK